MAMNNRENEMNQITKPAPDPMALFLLPLNIARGFVSSKCLQLLWLWFIVPLGARPVTWAQAFGIICVMAVFRELAPPSHQSEFKAMSVGDTASRIFGGMFANLFITGAAWLVMRLAQS